MQRLSIEEFVMNDNKNDLEQVMHSQMQRVRDMSLVAGGLIVALVLVAVAVAVNIDEKASWIAVRLEQSARSAHP